MRKDIEILPPVRSVIEKPKPLTITARVPGLAQHGAIDSYFATRRYGYTTKTANALTTLNNAEAALFNSQTAATVAKVKLDDALFQLQEAPERRGHELALRRAQRAHEIREVQHRYEVNEYRRVKEVKLAQAEDTHAKATLTHSRTVLKDAEQQYDAQVRYGGKTHELRHAKENLELLDIRLEEDERRALLRGQLRDIEEEQMAAEIDEDIAKILGEHRDALDSAGLDTSRVDRVLNRRRFRSRADERLEAEIEEDIDKIFNKK